MFTLGIYHPPLTKLDQPSIGSALLQGVYQAGEHEENNDDGNDDDTKFLPGLVEGVEEALETGEVLDDLEDT